MCGSDGGTGRNMVQWVGSGVPARETGHGAVGKEGNREGASCFFSVRLNVFAHKYECFSTNTLRKMEERGVGHHIMGQDSHCHVSRVCDDAFGAPMPQRG